MRQTLGSGRPNSPQVLGSIIGRRLAFPNWKAPHRNHEALPGSSLGRPGRTRVRAHAWRIRRILRIDTASFPQPSTLYPSSKPETFHTTHPGTPKPYTILDPKTQNTQTRAFGCPDFKAVSFEVSGRD